MAWSEPIYIFLSILFFLLLASYFEKPKSQKLLLCSAIALFVCLQRYIVVILVANRVTINPTVWTKRSSKVMGPHNLRAI
jgi:hypothetical protein